MRERKQIFIIAKILIFLCLCERIICESTESSSAADVEENEEVETDSPVPPPTEVEKVLTEAENVDLTEPISSTPSIVTEKSVVVKASTHTTPLNIVTEKTKESAPANMIGIWDSDGKICLLAKFTAEFTIQKLKVELPGNAKVKGKCETEDESPLLQLIWEGFAFTITFSKKSNDEKEESWIVTSMELKYDTSTPIFDGTPNDGKKLARSKPLQLFETPLGKSYSCPSPEVVLLYSANKEVANVRLRNVNLQPFEVKDAKLSAAQRCGQVAIDSSDDAKFVQDETIPLAVGCTLGLLTLIILVGFSIHRAYTAAKVDYNTME